MLMKLLKDMGERGLLVDQQRLVRAVAETSHLPGERVKVAQKVGVDPLARKMFGLEKTPQEELRRVGTPEALMVADFRKAYRVYQNVQTFINQIQPDGIIRYTLKVGKTGRLYSSGALLTMVPLCRKCVVPRDNGTFYAFDYDQQEMRVIAALTKHEPLLEAIEGDVHAVTAEILQRDRSEAKTINYAFIFGMKPEAMRRVYKIKKSEMTRLMALLPIDKLSAATKRRTHRGMVRTMYGDMIPFESDKERNNYCIQGTASGMLKRGIELLAKKEIKCTIVMHDSFLLETSDRMIKRILECSIDGVKFPVKMKEGKNWAEATK